MKRYEPDFAFNAENGYEGMYEKENGKFVKFSDVEHLVEALKTAHDKACSCCDSSGEVQRHCQEALSKIGMGE